MQFEKLMDRIDEFPTLPAIYNSLTKKMADPNVGPNDLARIIETDPSSTTKLIKLVNSPLYGLRARVDNIPQAIMYLGFNEVKNALLTQAVLSMFSTPSGSKGFTPVELWKHSIAVGVAAKELGRKSGTPGAENLFIAGVLHDIGKLFFLKVFQAMYIGVIKLVEEGETPLIDAEKKKFGMDHAAAGHLIAQKWNLPENLAVCIKSHHMEDESENDISSAFIHIANSKAISLDLGHSGDKKATDINPRAFEITGITPDEANSHDDEIKDKYSETLAVLEL
ncbi:MAG: HDOD domain-containing protein [Candidatus Kapaibacterium sp.]